MRFCLWSAYKNKLIKIDRYWKCLELIGVRNMVRRNNSLKCLMNSSEMISTDNEWKLQDDLNSTAC